MINNNNHSYVDLGLPSGILWATCNLGAKSPEERGLYFSWGETNGYAIENDDKLFEHSDYKLWDDSIKPEHAIKYNSQDEKMILEPEDDAVHVNLGGDWRMPTQEEFDELIKHTNNKAFTFNGVKGRKFINKKDESKFIFIPYSGYCNYGQRHKLGVGGYLWSSSLSKLCKAWAHALGFIGSDILVISDCRYIGFPIRGVIEKKDLS